MCWPFLTRTCNQTVAEKVVQQLVEKWFFCVLLGSKNFLEVLRIHHDEERKNAQPNSNNRAVGFVAIRDSICEDWRMVGKYAKQRKDENWRLYKCQSRRRPAQQILSLINCAISSVARCWAECVNKVIVWRKINDCSIFLRTLLAFRELLISCTNNHQHHNKAKVNGALQSVLLTMKVIISADDCCFVEEAFVMKFFLQEGSKRSRQ